MKVQEMKDMIAAMKIEFEEAIDEKRQDFEATREELKVWAGVHWNLSSSFATSNYWISPMLKLMQFNSRLHIISLQWPTNFDHSFRAICEVKQMKITGLVPNPESMRINTKSPKFSQCWNFHMQRKWYQATKKPVFQLVLLRWGGPSYPCIGWFGV